MNNPTNITSKTEILADIEQDKGNERKLLSIAYFCIGAMKSRQMTPEDYAEIMVALAGELGFDITENNLAKAAAKYLSDSA